MSRLASAAAALPTLVLLSLAAPAPAQSAADATAQEAAQRDAEGLFYRAFFADRGLEDKEKALGLYRRFLDVAPRDKLAGQAARYAIQILRKAERQDEAEAIERKHAAILAETLPAGINANFLDPNADVAKFVGRFEAESREVFKGRHEIVKLMGLKPGAAVADIGAGTGFFTNLFAREVGQDGLVYAVELAPTLIPHLEGMAKTMKLPQIQVVRCTDRSTKLAPDSVDVAFICDVYHHFEHPNATMTSLYRAMRPGGQLFVIDFERIPGESRQWLLDHVRAGKEVFRSEIEAAGFVLVREEKADFLKENYFLHFEKKSG